MTRLWRRVREPLARSTLLKGALTQALVLAMRFTRWTNPLVEGSKVVSDADAEQEPLILALWHGQHLLAPVYYPGRREAVVMVSRSADAEINALVLEKFGFEPVRGSGGRSLSAHMDKGGARALVALKKALDGGKNVAMIADIPHGKPRDAGLGIILLARLSGRPIVPVAIATSRRKVVEKSWDKTVINLPFGRGALVVGPPIHVPRGTDDTGMGEKRHELTTALNAATAEAYRLADKAS